MVSQQNLGKPNPRNRHQTSIREAQADVAKEFEVSEQIIQYYEAKQETRELKPIVMRNAAEVAGKNLGERALGSALTTSAIPRERQKENLMKAVFLRFTGSVCVYLAISFPLAFASSEPLTHIATLKKEMWGRAPTIVFSPDGTLMAGGSTAVTNAKVDLWSTSDLQPVHSIKGVSEDVAFSPDGSVFITCMKQSIQLWDVATWRVIGILAEHPATITAATFSHNGHILATGDWDGTIKLWDIATQRNISTVNGHQHSNLVSSLDFSPDDKILASASWDNTVKLWNVDTGDKVATLNHVGSVYTVAFSPDGATLVSGASGGPEQRETLKVWDAATRSNIATFHGETVTSVDFSSNGDLLAVAAAQNAGQTVGVIDVATWTRLATYQAVSPWFVKFSPDDNILVSSSWHGEILIWAMWGASPSDLFPTIAVSDESTQVAIPDTNLRNIIASASSGLVTNAFTETRVKEIIRINGESSNISDLTGLESATNLITLRLDHNSISDISALRDLTGLTYLFLTDNLVSDISPLSNLTNLTTLHLYNNSIADISALQYLTKLNSLTLSGNLIFDISALSELTELTYLTLAGNFIDSEDLSALSHLTELRSLYVGGNLVSDISALADLVNLQEVNLNGNNIEDLSPLVQNTAIGTGAKVEVRNNPLNRSSLLVHIPALIERGVEVEFDDVEPPVTADANGDGEINILDLVLVAEHLGEKGARGVADINNDGEVNVLDLVLIADAIAPPP